MLQDTDVHGNTIRAHHDVEFSIAGGTGTLTAAQKAAAAAPLHASLWLWPYYVRGVSSSVFDAGKYVVAIVWTFVQLNVVSLEARSTGQICLFVEELLQMVKQQETVKRNAVWNVGLKGVDAVGPKIPDAFRVFRVEVARGLEAQR